jgi:hypothetical protein
MTLKLRSTNRCGKKQEYIDMVNRGVFYVNTTTILC